MIEYVRIAKIIIEVFNEAAIQKSHDLKYIRINQKKPKIHKKGDEN